MARIRTIKPEFWEDETIGLLSPQARLLFIATWNLADDEGLLRWTPAYIKASVFMYDDDVGQGEIIEIMGELEGAALVYPFKAGKAQQRCAWIVKFRNHQRINRPQPGKLPAPSLQNPAILRVYAERDGWTCHLCKQPIAKPGDPGYRDDLKASLDHLTPRIQGGHDYPSNIRTAHLSCNKSRGARSLTDSVNDSVNGSRPPSLTEGEGKGREKEEDHHPRGRARGTPPETSTAPDDDDPEEPTLRKRLIAQYGNAAEQVIDEGQRRPEVRDPVAWARKTLQQREQDGTLPRPRASPLDAARSYGRRMASADVDRDAVRSEVEVRWPEDVDAALEAFDEARRPLRAVQ